MPCSGLLRLRLLSPPAPLSSWPPLLAPSLCLTSCWAGQTARLEQDRAVVFCPCEAGRLAAYFQLRWLCGGWAAGLRSLPGPCLPVQEARALFLHCCLGRGGPQAGRGPCEVGMRVAGAHITSSSPLPAPTSSQQSHCSLEVWGEVGVGFPAGRELSQGRGHWPFCLRGHHLTSFLQDRLLPSGSFTSS